MKRSKQILAIVLAGILLLAAQWGVPVAGAEQTAEEELPLTQTLASGVREDGTLDGELVQQWVDAYLAENYWDHPGCQMSIAYWYSGNDESWYYHADDWIGGVNWYKLPMCMYYGEKLSGGEISPDTVVTGITLEYALSTTLENSSGPSIYSLVTDLAERESKSYTDLAKQYADLPESYFTSEFYNNAYTARLMMEITKTLYRGGEERFPHILESMKKSQPEDLFKRDWIIRSSWEVAQTHAADWGGEGDDLIHCTGIFYTPTPMVLTVMTRNIWDLDIIGGIAGHFANLAVEMYNRQQAHGSIITLTGGAEMEPNGNEEENSTVSEATEQGLAAGEERPLTVPEEQHPDSDLQPEEETVQDDDPKGTEPSASASAKKSSPLLLIVLFTVLLLLIAAEIVLLITRRRKRGK